MDRDSFIKEFESTYADLDKYTMNEALEIVTSKTAPLSETAATPESRQILISMEEFAELSVEISKYLRGKGDKFNLLQEFADVCIVLANIKRFIGLTDDEINRAIQVKIERYLSSGEEKYT